MGPSELAKLPSEQRDAFLAMPEWAKGAYIVATGAAFIGGIMLLLRKTLARPLYILSLIAVLLQFGWVFLIYDGKLQDNAFAFPAFIVAMAIVQIWFAGFAARKGWLS